MGVLSIIPMLGCVDRLGVAMRIPMTAAVIGLTFASGCAPQAPAQNIGSVSLLQSSCNDLTIKIYISASWEPAPNPNRDTYEVFRIVGTSMSKVASSDSDQIHLAGLSPFTPYHYVVQARSRIKDGWGLPIYRQVGELKTVTPTCTTTPATSAQPGDVRLRHQLTSKCLFGEPVDGGPAKTWSCWQDPKMAVALEPLGGAEYRIRLRASGKCLFGNPVNGGAVKNWTCWNDPNMVWVREDLGNNRARFRHKPTGQCMYGSPTNGGIVKNWPCWDDANMVWVVDPF